MRLFQISDGALKPVADRESAHEVLMTIEELEALERKLQNKIEEAERWRKRATGEDSTWKINRRVLDSKATFPRIIYLSVPVPSSPEYEEEALRISKNHFKAYMEKGYTLQHTSRTGFSLGLRLTNDEYHEVISKLKG